MSDPVTIVGAGLAGLSCARELKANGIESVILEASDGIGGRIRTDEYQAFLLDRGFQVLLTAYPECRRLLNYDELKLKPFYPGAMIRFGGKFHHLVDPWRHPADAVSSLGSPIGTFTDKLRIASLRTSVKSVPVADLFRRPEMTTAACLSQYGFSDKMVNRFFRPFFGGIFLERELTTSSRVFEFLFRMFSDGDTSVPSNGMRAIASQLGHELDVRLNSPVSELPSGTVVVATDEPHAALLLGEPGPAGSRFVHCAYFAAEEPPISDAILILNGDGTGPVNNCTVMSAVAPSYAPPGAALISVSTFKPASEADIVAQLRDWFGAGVNRWQHLKTYSIPYAQPIQNSYQPRAAFVRPGVYRCGDYCETASLEGALVSGRRAAAALIDSNSDRSKR